MIEKRKTERKNTYLVLGSLAVLMIIYMAGTASALTIGAPWATTAYQSFTIGSGLTLSHNYTLSATGGGGTPSAPYNSIQFNNNGVFGGLPFFTENTFNTVTITQALQTHPALVINTNSLFPNNASQPAGIQIYIANMTGQAPVDFMTHDGTIQSEVKGDSSGVLALSAINKIVFEVGTPFGSVNQVFQLDNQGNSQLKNSEVVEGNSTIFQNDTVGGNLTVARNGTFETNVTVINNLTVGYSSCSRFMAPTIPHLSKIVVLPSGCFLQGGNLTVGDNSVTNNLTAINNITTTNITAAKGIYAVNATNSPIINNNGQFGILQASATSNGFLSSQNWTTFNSKGSGIANSVNIVGATGALTTICSNTPASIGIYQITGYITVNTITVDTLQLQTNYKNELGSIITQSQFPMGTTSATLSLSGAYAFPTFTIRANSGRAIVVNTILTTGLGGSANYDVGCTITRLSN